jgi:LmbE family N-acetylglucosaminyl deacetylase
MNLWRFSRRVVALAAVVAGLCVAMPPAAAQLRPRPVANETGDVALQLLLRKLRMAGTFMMTTAHPDDENNGLLVQMSHGAGLRTVLVTATRGDGGQNEIGPEILDGLAVLRTEELAAVHRFDGTEQFFTRAVDFGYSFSIDETYEKWGADEITGDFVRHIRAIRPDVIVGFIWDSPSGGLHHQASTHLTAEAFRAAADPARYPEQIREGLRPWQAKKFYYTLGFGGAPGGRGGGATSGPASVVPALGTYDPVLGRTYDEIGAEARTMHKCQGTSQVPPLPSSGGGGRGVHLQDCTIPGQLEARETSILDGLDLTLTGLAQYAQPSPPPALQSALAGIVRDVDAAEAGFKAKGLAGAVAPIAAGLHEVRSLRSGLGAMGLGADSAFEIDFRLAQKARQFQDALLVASAVRIEAVGDDPIVTPGQPVNLQIVVANRGAAPVGVTSLTASGFAAPPSCALQPVAPGGVVSCRATVTIPATAKPSDIYFRHDPKFARYVFDPGVPFGAPFAPTPFNAAIGLAIAGEPVTEDLPVEARYGTDLFAGEKRSELLVVPTLSLTLTPDIVVAPAGRASQREVRVTVRNNAKTRTDAVVRLAVPAGWTVDPASVPISVAREDEEASARFTVTAPASVRPGDARISAEARSAGATFTTGYQIVEYPHIRRRLLFHPAEATVKAFDVKVAPGLTVGYVMGVGDKVPDAIEQLGVPVSFIDADELAWGDLSKYPVIMIGVRAYDRRADLRANNARLMAYVRNGGVMLLNYQRTEFNPPVGPPAGYGPYPAQTTALRVTDENAPVRLLVPNHPVFNVPNKIGPATWADWVQERGTYFLGQYAPPYVDLIESEDPFPNNAGPKRGVLVEAQSGKGRWIYIGLVLWRELPAGVPGAYQLLANLISLGAK